MLTVCYQHALEVWGAGFVSKHQTVGAQRLAYESRYVAALLVVAPTLLFTFDAIVEWDVQLGHAEPTDK
jgi:hypothetical protein